PFVTVSRIEPETASFRVIFASAITAPDGSDTTPVKVAKIPWPCKDPTTNKTKHVKTNRYDVPRLIKAHPFPALNNNDFRLRKTPTCHYLNPTELPLSS